MRVASSGQRCSRNFTQGGKLRLYVGECLEHGLFQEQEEVRFPGSTVELSPTEISELEMPDAWLHAGGIDLRGNLDTIAQYDESGQLKLFS